MQIDIQARHFTLTEAIQNHTEQRIQSTFSCCNEHIQKVVIRLSDINGPRGGEDKLCLLHITLKELSDVIVEDIEADIYIAINRAIDRGGRTVVRKIERRRDLLRQ